MIIAERIFKIAGVQAKFTLFTGSMCLNFSMVRKQRSLSHQKGSQ